jgi:hypothetical protein
VVASSTYSPDLALEALYIVMPHEYEQPSLQSRGLDGIRGWLPFIRPFSLKIEPPLV